ncbi:hypothetical protein KPH14_008755 [Odynerus spinipes]|uniref:Uncharacterized protein n=1 Tax=Odynerus spinipes TaxID=1348599 RepID=A0AAD9R889_9HYME|nr:hypothetical protein KPH14_008755 [Odynerus spinipes]
MMTATENSDQSKTINILSMKDKQGATVPAICIHIDKVDEKPATTHQQHDDNVLSTSALATCRKKYPSGCTILECRLDASNKPVAHVLQVPGDSDATCQKMSVLVEAKQTPRGPYSRVTSCAMRDTREPLTDEECPKNAGMLMTYALESGDSSKNNDYNNEEPISKIVYGKTTKESQEASNDQDSCEPPQNYVEHDQTKTNKFTENIVRPKEMIYRSPPNCEETCGGAQKYNGVPEDKSQACFSKQSRNGLDPTDLETMFPRPYEKSPKKSNRVCPPTCCKPIIRFAQDTTSKPLTTTPEPVTVSKKYSKDALSVTSSQDSLERYKDYVSPNQLAKYRTCRSKRNGLQDECFLPLPRGLLEREKQEREQDHPDYDRKTFENECEAKTQSSRKILSKPPSTDRSSQKSANRKKRRLKRVKSRELYAGQVFVDCDCYHRNGLQHDCPRTLCGGEPCMEIPLPKCDLGSYFVDKWNDYHDKLDRLMPTSYCGTEEQWQEEILKRKNGNYRKEGNEDKKSVRSGGSKK